MKRSEKVSVAGIGLLSLSVAGLVAMVFILGLPGRIAIARKHPNADAVNIMGWAGFLVVVPWIQAFIWAFKPTTVIDSVAFILLQGRWDSSP